MNQELAQQGWTILRGIAPSPSFSAFNLSWEPPTASADSYNYKTELPNPPTELCTIY